ncbi:MAG: hypothetical protein Q9218_002514 [Villophora microphyllina]
MSRYHPQQGSHLDLTMPTDDYTSAAGGGLRLKGVNASSKISKHKKKRSKPPAETEKGPPKPDPEALKKSKDRRSDQDDGYKDDPDKFDRKKVEEEEIAEAATARGKTQAELQHEERRRRRVCDTLKLNSATPEETLLTLCWVQLEERLKREGTKTHKERVEEFNHYLSNLSEHHDMPRIGPG